MSQNALSVPIGCCDPCIPAGTSSTPGPQGAAGAAGADGTDGQNAFTLTLEEFEMPAEGGTTASFEIVNSDWMAVGQIVFVQAGGVTAYMVVASIPDSTHITLTNPSTGSTATDEYADNAAPTTPFPVGAKVQPGGVQGPTGAAGANPAGALLSANNLSDVANIVTSRANLGIGTAGARSVGVGDTNVPVIDDIMGLTAGEAVFATASGIESLAEPQARSALGLSKGVADGAIPPVDDAAGLTAGEALFATASGIESLTAAAARTALGITSGATSMLLYAEIPSPVDTDGPAGTGAWQTVPLSNELVDDGGYGSLAADEITLAAGTYRYNYGFPAYGAGRVLGRLVYTGTGNAIPDSYSLPIYAPATSTVLCVGQGQFEILVSTTIRIEALLNGGVSLLGRSLALGLPETYGFIQLFRE
jgi:hypothetical protein